MRTRMFMLALVFGSSGRIVQAQADGPALPPLRYEAPAGCPDQNFFADRMRARLRADGVAALPSLSLHVKIESGGKSVRGVVEISRDSTRAQRNLEGDNCREVVEGLALIAALAVAAPAASVAKPRSGAAPSSTAPPRSSARTRNDASLRGRSPHEPARPPDPPPTAAATNGSSTAEPAPSEAPAAVPAAPQASNSERPQRPQVLDDSTPPTAEHASGTGVASNEARLRGFSLGAAVLAVHGLAPRIQPGLQLEAALTLGEGALDWSIRAGGRIALDDTLRSPQGLARFGFVAGVVQLCASGALGASGFTLAGCAVVEPGILSARGEDTRKARKYTRPWLAAGAGAELGWRVASWLALQLGAEALVPTRRDRMLLADDLLHRVTPVCLRLQLGLEVPLG
ncbi:MAG TPA: hypothetical protein VFG30_20500 [Polyangiales bacterium]|nr:hypothetical protein [Polyangiales bacterium]